MAKKTAALVTVPPPRRAQFRRLLLRWYAENARPFPWRRTKDRFAILVSEVLLQRTQALQVAAHFDNILRAFPTPAALAAARTKKIARAIGPLGLSKRAGTLRKMGAELVGRFEGVVPDEVSDLRALPGVGRYIASATACFAGGKRAAIVDANVVRVLGRYFDIESKRTRPRDDDDLWGLAQQLLPRARPVDYNRALIDFAAVVCRPRNPQCAECPLRGECRTAPRLLDAV